MAFDRPIAFDSDKDTIRATARCTAADTVRLEVDTNSGFTAPIVSANVVADSGADFTATLSVGGLQADTLYYHRFVVNDTPVTYDVTPVGGGGGPASLKTAPADSYTGTVKIAAGSCQLYGNGSVWEQMDGKAPDVVVNLGDRVYVDTDSGNDPPTAQSEFYDSYKLTHRNDTDAEARWMRYVLFKRAFKAIMDDHDHSRNDINIGMADYAQTRAWAMHAFSAYTPHATYVRSDAQFRTERWGHTELFFLDNRFAKQDPADYERWPSSGADNHVIHSTSTRSQIVIEDGGAGHIGDKSAGAYAGWYVRLAQADHARTVVRPPRTDMWRRVANSFQTPGFSDRVTLVLDSDLPASFAPGTDQYLFMEKASVLDGGVPFAAGNQWDWIVDALNASTAKVKIICSQHIMSDAQVGGDNWRAMSALNGEVRALYQATSAVKNVFVVSGDMHRHMQDDGTNAEWPEVSCSPWDQAGSTGAVGTWSHGQADRPTTNPDLTSNGFAILTITDTEFKSEMFWSDASATVMGGITTMTVPLEEEPGPPAWSTSRPAASRRGAPVAADYRTLSAIGLDPTGEDLTSVETLRLMGGRVRWNATATVGDRLLRLLVLEDFGSGDVEVGGYDLLTIPAGGTTTAQLVIPEGVWLRQGQTLRVVDDNGVDASDDADIYLQAIAL